MKLHFIFASMVVHYKDISILRDFEKVTNHYVITFDRIMLPTI